MLRTCLLALGLPLALLLNVDSTAAQTDMPTLTSEQRQEIKSLLVEFRRTRESPEDRDAIVTRLLDFGLPAVVQLREIVDKELHGQLKSYGQAYRRQAAALFQQRLSQIDVAEIKKLRATVLALKNRANLTKEMILDEGDPALERLNEILVVSPDEILENDQLQDYRDAMMEIGGYWERCQQYLATQRPTADDDDELPTFDAYLRGEEQLVSQLATPMDQRNRAVMTANTRLTSSLDTEEVRAILACNLMRNLLGLNVLAIDVKLCQAARDHSSDMERLDFFDHESPVPGKSSPWDRAKRFATSASGENIFMGRTDGRQVNLGWFHSPGHHKNMLDDHRRIGMGRSGTHFTELFGD